jgi:U4/U6.U5 tri-snRNP-associated protein 2
MKRGQEEEVQGALNKRRKASTSQVSVSSSSEDEGEEEQRNANGGRGHQQKNKSFLVSGKECPYLDQIARQRLDFDFEKCCSVSMLRENCYACLVCGKYFQGRGMNTNAYTHALEESHNMFMNLQNGQVYCLPDGYQVADRSLEDIKQVK